MARRRNGGNRMKPVAVGWRQRMAAPLALLRRVVPPLLLVAAAAVGLWQLNGALAVDRWQVRCDDKALRAAISARLEQMAPLGFVAGYPALVARRLARLEPDIATIEVVRVLPNRLRVRATIRQPVALWTGGDGRVMLVDGAGAIYRPLRRGEARDLPLLRVRDRALVPSLARLLDHLRAKRPQLTAAMSEMIAGDGQLRINLARGAQWRLPLDDALVSRVDHIIALLGERPWRHGVWKVDARLRDRWFIRAGSGDREVI